MEQKSTPSPKLKPFVAGVEALKPSQGWPACAFCDQSLWMLDANKPIAFCQVLNGLTFGADGRFISKCEAQNPVT